MRYTLRGGARGSHIMACEGRAGNFGFKQCGHSAWASERDLLAGTGSVDSATGGRPGDPVASGGLGMRLTARRTLTGYEGWRSSVP
jgi:hypothetical protein